MSVNIELPTTEGLSKLAPHKKPENLVKPLRQIQDGIASHRLAIGKDPQMERSNSSKYQVLSMGPKRLVLTLAIRN